MDFVIVLSLWRTCLRLVRYGAEHDQQKRDSELVAYGVRKLADLVSERALDVVDLPKVFAQ